MLFQIHTTVVTYGESTASPADIRSKLPQPELQTALRSQELQTNESLLLNVGTE